ncbi:MAG: UDP-2,3-diacylglucosamine diphosphatase [Exilibacterium sp.]
MTTYFISDLHLDESRPAIARAFFTWLDSIADDAEALYILGDFFEAWVGDDDDTPFNDNIIEHLGNFSRPRRRLYIMHGNRDFLIGEDFAHRTAATLLADPTRINLYGKTVLLMHGDSLCTGDTDYMAFRRQVRQREWQAQLLTKPVGERRALAAQLRTRSQSVNSLKAADIMDVTPTEVVREMETHGVQVLIHGHTHRPARHMLWANGKQAQRIVLGDWGAKGWCLAVSAEAGWELKSWDIGVE